jgi:acyl-lipid omega-6 desaturase (Delta-12 desaturase)
MYASLSVSYWLVFALAFPAAGLVVRIFAIQHDCGHYSFLISRKGNQAVGRVCSLVTFTPFASWLRQHAGHHGSWNNLDRRDSGIDIFATCLTVAEYRALSACRRLLYRIGQHPLVALVLLPPLVFLVLYRIPFDMPATWVAERRSVWLTDAALLSLYSGLGFALGFKAMILVQLPVIAIAAVAGVWLFSLQHRFESTIWMRSGRWDAASASLARSSFLKLPKALQWFSGNIGFHHIHHLDTRVPNYRLEVCHESYLAMRSVATLDIRRGLAAWRYALWDESCGRMVTFRQAVARD